MACFQAWFEKNKSLELVRTRFVTVHGEVWECVRGKVSYTRPAAGTFQWTSAVHAFSILLLQEVARSFANEKSVPARLSGNSGSPASSLDYTIKKQPAWILEMFGWDKEGRGYCASVFSRDNPGQKRAGPVTISFSKQIREQVQFAVYCNGSELRDVECLQQLAKQIEHEWEAAVEQCEKDSASQDATFAKLDRTTLRAMVSAEAARALRNIDIFNPTSLTSHIQSLATHPSFRGLAGKNISLLNSLPHSASTADRLGVGEPDAVIRSEFATSTPLTVAVSSSSAGTFALFRYLKLVKGYNIDIWHNFPHAVDIYDRIFNSGFAHLPDIAALGVGPAGRMIGLGAQAEYRPALMLPSISHRVIAPRQAKRARMQPLGSGKFLLLKDDPTTASFYFDDLLSQGQLDRRMISIQNAECHEIFHSLKDGDETMRAVLWFPFYEINKLYNNCEYLDQKNSRLSDREVLMFAHSSVTERRLRALILALRDAWLTLREGGPAFDFVVDHIAEDSTYRSYVTRFAGMQ